MCNTLGIWGFKAAAIAGGADKAELAKKLGAQPKVILMTASGGLPAPPRLLGRSVAPTCLPVGGLFLSSKASQAAGREYLKRLESRKKDYDLPVSRDSAVPQLAAIREWGTISTTGRYATLKEITHPRLIVHGNKDAVVAPINALLFAEQLPNVQLIVYSDSSHGAQFNTHGCFLSMRRFS